MEARIDEAWLDVNDMVLAAEVLLEAIALNAERP